MAATGIILRKELKAALVADAPVQGEMVFATDTGEHGWINKDGILVWKDLSVESGTTLPYTIETFIMDPDSLQGGGA